MVSLSEDEQMARAAKLKVMDIAKKNPGLWLDTYIPYLLFRIFEGANPFGKKTITVSVRTSPGGSDSERVLELDVSKLSPTVSTGYRLAGNSQESEEITRLAAVTLACAFVNKYLKKGVTEVSVKGSRGDLVLGRSSSRVLCEVSGTVVSNQLGARTTQKVAQLKKSKVAMEGWVSVSRFPDCRSNFRKAI